MTKQPSVTAWRLGFPIVSVLLFVYVFGSAMNVGAGTDYKSYAVPGMFAMTMAFGFMGTAIAVVIDRDRGVTDRFRSLPMAPSAVVTGRGVSDVVHAALDLAVLAAIAQLFAVAFPFGMISSVFTPPHLMPDWLGAIAMWNPVSSTANAVRELFGNPMPGGDSWIENHALLMAVVWPLIITAVFLPLAVCRYQHLSR